MMTQASNLPVDIPLWCVTLTVDGIAKRDRKVKRHRLEVAFLPDTGEKPEVTAEIIAKARTLLASIKQSTDPRHRTPSLHFTAQVETRHHNYSTIAFRLYDPRSFSVPLV